MCPKLLDLTNPRAVIKVIGVGGAGGNAINAMIKSGLSGIKFITVDSDLDALKASLSPIKIPIGIDVNDLENRTALKEVINGSDMVIVIAGTGGYTSGSIAPVIAKIARDSGALTVALVTKPFEFESYPFAFKCNVQSLSDNCIQNLCAASNTVITIPNQQVYLSIANTMTSVIDLFKLSDEILLTAVKSILNIIFSPTGLSGIDFGDVSTVFCEKSKAFLGIGSAVGYNRANEAAHAAFNSPFLEGVDIATASGILVNITGPEDMTMLEVNNVATLFYKAANEDVNMIFQYAIDASLIDRMYVEVFLFFS